MFHELWSRLESRFRHRDLEREMDAEMQFHLAMQIEKNAATGMSPEEARRTAVRDFGGAEQMKEVCRDARHTWLDSVWQDVRYALRGFHRDRAFTLTVVLTLALAIGATTSTFTIVDSTLFRPLPYDKPDRVVMLMGRSPASGQVYETLSKEQGAALRLGRSLAVVASYSLLGDTVQLLGGTEPETVTVGEASSDLFAVLGVSPFIGRAFREGEGRAGSARVVILTHGFWQRRYGGDRSVVGREILLKHDSPATPLTGPATIVGVMPQSFSYPRSRALQQPDLLFAEHVDWNLTSAKGESFFLLGRLKDGVSLRDAQADADVAAAATAPPGPAQRAPRLAVLALRSQMVAYYYETLLTALGAVLFLLLIACVNVASLMMARGGAREREFAIRASLGAGRGRIARQLITESTLLAFLGAAVGVVVSLWTLDILVAQLPSRMRIFDDITLNARVLSFSALVTIGSIVVFGGIPALSASKPDLMPALKIGPRRRLSRGKGRAGTALLSVEVALTLILLVGAGLLLNSFVRMQRVDFGFDPSNLVALSIQAPPSRYASEEQALQFFEQVDARVRAVPGVRSAATADDAPFSGGLFGSRVTAEGRAPERADTYRVAAGYFETLGLPAIAGRVFVRADERSEPVAVINESLARRYWSIDNAVGRTMTVSKNQQVRIVGVVRDVRATALTPPKPTVYMSYDQAYRRFRYRTLIVRTVPGPGDVNTALAAELRRIDRELTSKPELLTDWLARGRVSPRFYALIYGAFAAIGLLLASVGIAGIAAHNVVRRTHEIGVRLALGSTRPGAVRMVARQVVAPIGAGVIAGLAGAAALTTTLARLLFDIEPHDPATYALVVALLCVVALVATWLPARRAARVSPIEVLRAD